MASTAVQPNINMADTSNASPATATAGTSHSPAAHEPPAPPPPKPKRGRKKKDPDDKDKDKVPKEKEKKTTTRRPRASTAKASKDVDKENSGASSSARKKQKLEHESAVKIAPAQPVRQARISDLVSPADPVQAGRHVSASAGSTSPPLLATARRNFTHPSIHSPGAHAMTQGGSHESTPDPRSSYHSFSLNPDTASATPPQRSSGQNYDPIRSTTIETPTSFPQTLPSMVATRNTYSPPPNTNTPPPRAPFRASASPAISSIIDPVPTAYKFVPTSVATSPRPATTEPVTSTEKPQDQEIKERNGAAAAAAATEPATKDNENNKLTTQKKGNNGSRAPSTGGASSPKPSRKEKDAPRLAGKGSGLLTNALFGVNMGASTKDEKTAPDIILHVPLHGANNQVVNFARMAEDKYGFEALNPRVAAQKARRAEIDAASSALEKTEKNVKGDSGAEEDLSLDGEKDSDVDGDIVMGGTATTDANGTAASETTVQKRRRKVEDYDRDDPFVDDSEMVWQEQAATCKDGFFVYSGPLVPEGEKVTVERADGTIKRGRGRGRGAATAAHTHSSSDKPARGRGGAHNHTRDKDGAGIGNHPDAHNPSATDGPAPATTSGRGRGRGSGTTRKPRVTKADRAQMEREKAEREKAGLALAAVKKQEGA